MLRLTRSFANFCLPGEHFDFELMATLSSNSIVLPVVMW